MKDNKLTISPATFRDLKRVSQNLRQQDQEEINASGVDDPMPNFLAGLEAGFAYAVRLPNGDACAVGGIIPSSDPEVGYPWLMGTDELTLHWREFCRRIPGVLDEVHKAWPVLTNEVHEGNSVHRRWLKWAGFTILPEPLKRPAIFYKFIRIQHANASTSPGRS